MSPSPATIFRERKRDIGYTKGVPDSTELKRKEMKVAMKFIELTGESLEKIIDDGELHDSDLKDAGVSGVSIVRINQQGDIEIRRPQKWDVIGGLLGNFEERVKKSTGLDWA